MKLYLSSAIVDTSLSCSRLIGASFEKYGDEKYLKLYTSEGLVFPFYSTDMDADKEVLKKYFKNLEKQESEK